MCERGGARRERGREPVRDCTYIYHLCVEACRERDRTWVLGAIFSGGCEHPARLLGAKL